MPATAAKKERKKPWVASRFNVRQRAGKSRMVWGDTEKDEETQEEQEEVLG